MNIRHHAYRRKARLSWSIQEGTRHLVRQRNIGCSHDLSRSSIFLLSIRCVLESVQQRGLAMIHFSHDRHDEALVHVLSITGHRYDVLSSPQRMRESPRDQSLRTRSPYGIAPSRRWQPDRERQRPSHHGNSGSLLLRPTIHRHSISSLANKRTCRFAYTTPLSHETGADTTSLRCLATSYTGTTQRRVSQSVWGRSRESAVW